MFRYQPPKSSIWGHRLRRMPAGRASTLLREFLETDVARSTFGSAHLVVHGEDRPLDERLAEAVGASLGGAASLQLSPEGAERAIAAIAGWEAEHPGRAAPVNLAEMYTIEAWRIGGRVVATSSILTMHYGALPCLSTFFQFERREEFDRIRDRLRAIGLCTLSPAHLKEVRDRRRRAP